jgi:hypothetical protein
MEGLIEEYKTLREEIIAAKGRRLQTTSMTVGALGVLLSVAATVVFGKEIPTAETRFIIALGGGIAMYCVLIPCQIMNISLQQTIQRIGDYIRIYIEPLLPGLNWETRWRAHKKQHHLAGGVRGIGGIYVLLAFLPWMLPIYTFLILPDRFYCLQFRVWPVILVLFLCFGLSCAYSVDMHIAHSKGWKWNWKKPKNSLHRKRMPSKHRLSVYNKKRKRMRKIFWRSKKWKIFWMTRC